MGWASGEHNIFLYADSNHIAGQKPIWVQKTLTAVVRMLETVFLQMNLGNTKVIVCTSGLIWGQKEGSGRIPPQGGPQADGMKTLEGEG